MKFVNNEAVRSPYTILRNVVKPLIGAHFHAYCAMTFHHPEQNSLKTKM